MQNKFLALKNKVEKDSAKTSAVVSVAANAATIGMCAVNAPAAMSVGMARLCVLSFLFASYKFIEGGLNALDEQVLLDNEDELQKKFNEK